MAHDVIYLDHAAATPLDERVLAAMQPYFSEQFYNPSALYSPARFVHKALGAARQTVAGVLGVRPVEVVFTAGGTESDNLAIHGVMRAHPGSNLVVSAIEHDAVLQPAQTYRHKIAPVDTQGAIQLDQLAKLIDDDTVLISAMYANNEIGTVQPIRKIAALVAEVRADRRTRGITKPLYLHSDACQAAQYLDVHVSRLGVDLLTLNGGKIYGPKQSGILYVKAGLVLEPLVRGGGQEWGMRSGTENVAACIGFAEALSQAQTNRSIEGARVQLLQSHFLRLIGEQLPKAIVNGSRKQRLPNNVHITLPGADNERLLVELDERGILAAAGSACSASSDTPSHVLRAIGLDDADAQASLRFSMGRVTTETDLQRVVAVLAELYPSL